MREEINRALVEIAVRQALRSIRRAPERTLRNLVDLGAGLTKGVFSKHFYAAIQEMLQQQDSPYYRLLKDVVANVDNDTLRIFGMNFGYNGCTKGARQIRNAETMQGIHVPWALSIQVEGTSDALALEDWSGIIADGMQLGIYIYMVFCDAASFPTVERLCRIHSDCAFVCFLSPSAGFFAPLRTDERLHNLACLIETADSNFGRYTQALRADKCLYGAYHAYGEEELEYILSNAWIESAAQAHCTFAFLLEKPECPVGVRETATAYVWDAREHQRFPTIPMAYFEDYLWIDRVISEEAYFMGITANGEVITQQKGTPAQQSIRTHSLGELLQLLWPPVSDISVTEVP